MKEEGVWSGRLFSNRRRGEAAVLILVGYGLAAIAILGFLYHSYFILFLF